MPPKYIRSLRACFEVWLDFRIPPMCGLAVTYAYSRFFRFLLAAVIMLGGSVAHARSVSHSDGDGFAFAHEHAVDYRHAHVHDDLPEEGQSSPNDSPHICMDAHCCTPAVEAAASRASRHAPNSEALTIAPSQNYALSIPRSLLRPPRPTA